jgi:hypothetical protein
MIPSFRVCKLYICANICKGKNLKSIINEAFSYYRPTGYYSIFLL